MKRVVALVIISFCILTNSISFAAEKVTKGEDGQPILPNVFIWQIPDDDDSSSQETTTKISKKDKKASKTAKENAEATETSDTDEESEITLQKPKDVQAPVKGYAEYEDNADTIYMVDDNNNFVLNLRIPQKFSSQTLVYSKKIKQTQQFGHYTAEEYSISPKSFTAMEKKGNLSYGTQIDSGIDTSEFDRSTTFFTKYEKKYFSISSAYQKNDLTTRGIITDKFYFAPELKLNKYMSLSEVFAADVTRRRNSGELVLSVSPLKSDKMKMEFGAGTTYDQTSQSTWSQIRFNTKIKL